MTHQYIGTKIITAWPEFRNAKEGYAVKYEDGYISWSPKETFDEAYRIAEGPLQKLTFGDALAFLKLGRKLTRQSWWASGVFIYLVPAASYPAQTGAAKEFFGEDALVPYMAYLACKNRENNVVVFVPGMDSLLAEDWVVLE